MNLCIHIYVYGGIFLFNGACDDISMDANCAQYYLHTQVCVCAKHVNTTVHLHLTTSLH